MSRTLDYCGLAAVLGRREADRQLDRLTPSGVDMDFPPDADAQARRAEERAAQEEKCSGCLHHCPMDGPE